MNKQEFQTSKEATWRNHLARHAASGKSTPLARLNSPTFGQVKFPQAGQSEL